MVGKSAVAIIIFPVKGYCVDKEWSQNQPEGGVVAPLEDLPHISYHIISYL
jgi:hypothetical protein